MAVDTLLASSPVTITRQIVEQTNQQIKQVRETAEKALLPDPEETDQSAARPQSQPVGSAQPSSDENGLGQGSSENGENPEGEDNSNPFRGNAVNTTA